MNTGRNSIRGSFIIIIIKNETNMGKKSISDLTKSVKDYVMKLDKPSAAIMNKN